MSLYFRGDSVTSGTLLSGGGVSLSLVDRHLEWRDGISLVGTANSNINLYDDVWYQVYASRYGLVCNVILPVDYPAATLPLYSMGSYRYLSIAPLESSDNTFTFKTEFPGSVPTQISGNITIATSADKVCVTAIIFTVVFIIHSFCSCSQAVTTSLAVSIK